ncbi:MAG: YihY/virulence factor BrkB family protein [Ilumatobacter sp.]|uniref:YihY/virulence factor BrkB family protein n=1 Tax=Ilumatobacter sp. TaxID=1967498 RepID=UPI00391A8D47
MDLVRRLDRVQRERPWLATPVAVIRRFSEHDGGRMSAAVAFFAFFSVFPLLLVFVSVLDIILNGRPGLREDLVDSALGQLPIIGQQVSAPQSSGSGSIVTLAVGTATALWAGLAATAALASAFATVWDVVPSSRHNFLRKRAQGLAAVLSIAVLIAISTLVGNIAALFGVSPATVVLGLSLNLAVNIMGLMAVFHFLSPNTDPWRVHVPGAVIGGAVIFGLQQIGGWVARRYVENASDTYGSLAIVIGLLVWLHLVSRAIVLAAEFNAVRVHGLTPRSIHGQPDSLLTEADRRAMVYNTERVRHDEQLGVVVNAPTEVLDDARRQNDDGPRFPAEHDG